MYREYFVFFTFVALPSFIYIHSNARLFVLRYGYFFERIHFNACAKCTHYFFIMHTYFIQCTFILLYVQIFLIMQFIVKIPHSTHIFGFSMIKMDFDWIFCTEIASKHTNGTHLRFLYVQHTLFSHGEYLEGILHIKSCALTFNR